MTPEKITNNELEGWIHSALASNPELTVPKNLTERVVQKLVKRKILSDLILELVFKGLLVLGSLAVMAGVFIWINGSNTLSPLYSYFIRNQYIIISIFLLILITILIDQIGLRFYTTFKREAGAKV